MASVLDPTLPRPTMPTLTSCISSHDISGIQLLMCELAAQPTKNAGRPVLSSIGGQFGIEFGGAGGSERRIFADWRNEANSAGAGGTCGRRHSAVCGNEANLAGSGESSGAIPASARARLNSL